MVCPVFFLFPVCVYVCVLFAKVLVCVCILSNHMRLLVHLKCLHFLLCFSAKKKCELARCTLSLCVCYCLLFFGAYCVLMPFFFIAVIVVVVAFCFVLLCFVAFDKVGVKVVTHAPFQFNHIFTVVAAAAANCCCFIRIYISYHRMLLCLQCILHSSFIISVGRIRREIDKESEQERKKESRRQPK